MSQEFCTRQEFYARYQFPPLGSILINFELNFRGRVTQYDVFLFDLFSRIALVYFSFNPTKQQNYTNDQAYCIFGPLQNTSVKGEDFE